MKDEILTADQYSQLDSIYPAIEVDEQVVRLQEGRMLQHRNTDSYTAAYPVYNRTQRQFQWLILSATADYEGVHRSYILEDTLTSENWIPYPILFADSTFKWVCDFLSLTYLK